MALLLSIVIPAHRRPDLLTACLASVTRHAPPSTQVVVVDDGSVDGCISRVASRFPQVEIVRRPQAGGFCRAANAGVAAARGDIVQVLNDDTEVSAGWAAAALKRFADPSIAAVTPLVLIGPPGSTPPRVDSAGDAYFIGGVARKRGHGQVLGRQHLTPGPVFGASGSGSFFRRAVLHAVGGFPEEFIAYFDDVDLSFRLHRAGHVVWYEPTSVIHHHVGSSYGRPAGELLMQQSRNEELVYWRNLPTGVLLASLPAHLAVLLGKAIRRWREGQLWPFLSGRLSALAAVPAVLRGRGACGTAGPSWCLDWLPRRKMARRSPGLVEQAASPVPVGQAAGEAARCHGTGTAPLG